MQNVISKMSSGTSAIYNIYAEISKTLHATSMPLLETSNPNTYYLYSPILTYNLLNP